MSCDLLEIHIKRENYVSTRLWWLEDITLARDRLVQIISCNDFPAGDAPEDFFEGLLNPPCSLIVEYNAKNATREVSVRVLPLELTLEVDPPNLT